jgi:hypothetical protein
MVDVMRIDVPRVRATRESTAAIASVERAANRWRNTTRLTPDVERLSLRALHDADNAGITRESTRRLHREGRAVLEFAAARATLSQSLRIHMNNDLVSVS